MKKLILGLCIFFNSYGSEEIPKSGPCVPILIIAGKVIEGGVIVGLSPAPQDFFSADKMSDAELTRLRQDVQKIHAR